MSYALPMSLSPDQISRYARHLTLKEIGGPGQNALLAANVAIIGAGGLGRACGALSRGGGRRARDGD